MVAVVQRGDWRDEVAVEEPLEIRCAGRTLSVTMRTPGHDDELAAGFLFSEALVDRAPDVGLTGELEANTVEVRSPLIREPDPRAFTTTSACGVCGAGAIADVRESAAPAPPGPEVPAALLADLPERMRQPTFARTGGLHAAALFDAEGGLLVVREDVGRHNAVDKVVGRRLLDGALPLHGLLLCVSGRLSFELVHKAVRAGAPVLVGVGAPSSLAVELADELGLTLAGFARRGRVNVYAHAERVGSGGAR
ncbi:MAG TPA: formate dehydrogenase accessory sulfurtransferase FdhD [Solirubrobacteraceae bacterium]|nr:formate dehydrogenase accessory sulfurtransferase FdhD [Solirubrobacteraceae bacterium]